MNKLCRKYIKLIKKNYKIYVKSIIIYGSNIYDINSSDLDVCLITDEIPDKVREDIINSTINFHYQNGLKIDEEIPFNNKLIYTYKDVEDTLNKPPFYINGQVVIKKIEKNNDFLSSIEMKKRLLINILTTDHITIGKSTSEYEKRALTIIVNAISEYANLKNPTVNELLKNMYTDKYTGASGEMFLGYKTNNKNKEKYLIKELEGYLNDWLI